MLDEMLEKECEVDLEELIFYEEIKVCFVLNFKEIIRNLVLSLEDVFNILIDGERVSVGIGL